MGTKPRANFEKKIEKVRSSPPFLRGTAKISTVSEANWKHWHAFTVFNIEIKTKTDTEIEM